MGDIWDLLLRIRWFVIIALLCAVVGLVLVTLDHAVTGFAVLTVGLIVAVLEDRL